MAADSFLKAKAQKLFFEIPFSKWSEMEDDRQLSFNEREILLGDFQNIVFFQFI
jgi:hypothetical protein